MKPTPLIRSVLKKLAYSKRTLMMSGGLLALLTLAVTPVRGQQQLNCRPWGDIPEYKGTVTVNSTDSGTNQFGTMRKVNESVTYTFDATLPVPSCSSVMTWVGQTATLTYSIDDFTQDPCPPGQAPQQQELKASGTLTGVVPNAGYFNIAFQGNTGDLQPNTYTVQVPQFIPGKLTVTPCNSPSQTPTDVLVHYGPNEPQSRFVLNIPLPTPTPGSPLPTLASTGSQTVSDIPDPLGVPLNWQIGWTITPVQNFDVQVTIPDYLTWRPTAGVSEKDVGINSSGLPNGLVIEAKLVDKTTQLPVHADMDKATFTLTDVSREPGVALNWPPLGQATSAPDMSFDAQQNPSILGYTPSPDGTSLVFDPTVIGAPASGTGAVLSPRDWGGWATLHVTITVAGVDYEGHFQPPPPLVANNQTDILLPNRQPGSFIADSWKTAHGIALDKPDSDDSENVPQGDGLPGDGLTLYEEYRGFYMGCSDNIFPSPPQPEGTPGALCQHVEGDPTRKDLFVVDQIGVADPGIDIFAAISNLKVHYHGLKLDEVGPPQPSPAGSGPLYRAINFNFSAGPHEGGPGKYQHAVVLDWGLPSAGISTEAVSHTVTTVDYPCPDGTHSCPALPGEVDHIEIDPTLAKDINGAAFFPFVQSVAHELAHAVNVYHHGDVGRTRVWVLDSNQPPNVVECDVVKQTCTPVTVMTEDQNPSSSSATRFSFVGVDTSMSFKPCPSSLCLIVPVGNDVCAATSKVILNGLHSGDQNSVMRYADAQAYIPDGFPGVRIVVNTEDNGLRLTNHPIGTGVNNPSRQPRPRYGDAFAADGTPNNERGNDALQIDVNDNHAVNGAPIIRPPQPVCP